MQAVADKEYWIGTDGEYVLDRNGHCVRTIRWTPEAAIPGCEGAEAKEKAPVATKAAPVKSTPATEAVGMAVRTLWIRSKRGEVIVGLTAAGRGGGSFRKLRGLREPHEPQGQDQRPGQHAVDQPARWGHG